MIIEKKISDKLSFVTTFLYRYVGGDGSPATTLIQRGFAMKKIIDEYHDRMEMTFE